jgi:hypothetical protein
MPRSRTNTNHRRRVNTILKELAAKYNLSYARLKRHKAFKEYVLDVVHREFMHDGREAVRFEGYENPREQLLHELSLTDMAMTLYNEVLPVYRQAITVLGVELPPQDFSLKYDYWKRVLIRADLLPAGQMEKTVALEGVNVPSTPIDTWNALNTLSSQNEQVKNLKDKLVGWAKKYKLGEEDWLTEPDFIFDCALYSLKRWTSGDTTANFFYPFQHGESFPEGLRKNKQYHFRWLVQYHILGMTYEQIAQHHDETMGDEATEDEAVCHSSHKPLSVKVVSDAVSSTAKFVGLKLRQPRRGPKLK